MSDAEVTDTIRGRSPSQTALSESDLNKKALCDYVVNVADGCSHGCKFCYVPSMPQIWGDPGDKFAEAGIEDPSDEWGDYALYREDVVANTATDCYRIERTDTGWRTTRRGQGVVGISFGTDCYMDPRAGELTRGVVAALVGHERPVRILTRNPALCDSLHGEFYAGLPDDLVTIGTSIPSLDEERVHAIEPGAPPVEHRFRGLESLSDRGIRTFVSMSPTYPTQDHADLLCLLATIADRCDPEVVFHEPINPRSGNIEGCIQAASAGDCPGLANALRHITFDSEWRHYALRQLRDVQRAAEEVGQPVHLWPDSRLVKSAPESSQREWCERWRSRSSPETIGDGPVGDDPYPPIPAIDRSEQGTLDAYAGGPDRRSIEPTSNATTTTNSDQ